MKICVICNQEHQRKRTLNCLECSNKITLEKQKIYRKNNKVLCHERSKKSMVKKQEYYLQKRREYYRIKHGQPIDKPSTKRKAGEGNIDINGYKTITKRGHPNAMDDKGRIREHIYVMVEHLGRPLRKGESVHHKNGDRLDNRIENLELWCKFQPPGQRVEDKIKYFIEFLKSYGYNVVKE